MKKSSAIVETETAWCSEGPCPELTPHFYRRNPGDIGRYYCDRHARAKGFKVGEKPAEPDHRPLDTGLNFNVPGSPEEFFEPKPLAGNPQNAETRRRWNGSRLKAVVLTPITLPSAAEQAQLNSPGRKRVLQCSEDNFATILCEFGSCAQAAKSLHVSTAAIYQTMSRNSACHGRQLRWRQIPKPLTPKE